MFKGTTIIAVRRGDSVAIGGDGQVSRGNTIMKGGANKIRSLLDGEVIVGFAGSTADAFTLFERFEQKLKDHNGNLTRAAVELAKDWRLDKALRRLEALILAVDKNKTLLLSGTGDVIEPDGGVIAIGSGGDYAHAAATALVKHAPDLSAEAIVRESLTIAADICIYTNHHHTVKVLSTEAE
ncbi:MAG: ATP-dependent HslUV protease subunit HslV [Myxococcota bacterium]|jgi:ATP-dependent HslUV protease subunit HslV